jgi:hypothetical protein
MDKGITLRKENERLPQRLSKELTSPSRKSLVSCPVIYDKSYGPETSGYFPFSLFTNGVLNCFYLVSFLPFFLGVWWEDNLL